jgi:serine/threonine protein kinase
MESETAIMNDITTQNKVDHEIQNIPGYEIIETLGYGGMANVYLAIQQGFNRKVALKVMSRHLLHDEQLYLRFRREAEIVAQFNSPHIIQVYEVGEYNGLPFFSMEYLAYGTLSTRIMKGFDPESALNITRQVAVALKTTHEHDWKFIHRDVKPGNILFRDANTAVLTDFGIARNDNLFYSDPALTIHGQVIGTSKYMSPEQAKGEVLNPQTDLYSLGIVLFQMLTKELPYTGSDFTSIAVKKINDPVPRLAKNISYIQPIIDSALAKDKSERFKNATEFIDAILAIQSKPRKKNWLGFVSTLKWLTVLVVFGVLLSLLFDNALLQFRSAFSAFPNTTNSSDSHKLDLKTKPSNAQIYHVKQKRFLKANTILETGTYEVSVWAPQYLILDLNYKHPSNSKEIVTLQKLKSPTASLFYHFLDALRNEIPSESEAFIRSNPLHPLGEILRVAVLKDHSRLDIIKRHARVGDEQSLLILSELYDNGWGVKQDKIQALELARRAAQFGYTIAQVQYATLILSYNPTAEQLKKAVAIYDEAASHGFFLGLNRRAKLYINGAIGGKNIEKGLDFLTKAASLGDRDALFLLGQIYYQGLDTVPKNKIKANSYFEHAAKLGDQRAIARLPVKSLPK